jgi:hypothetical protein
MPIATAKIQQVFEIEPIQSGKSSFFVFFCEARNKSAANLLAKVSARTIASAEWGAAVAARAFACAHSLASVSRRLTAGAK